MSLFRWFRRKPSAVERVDVDPRILPHWARVAFAARCARRGQALYVENYSDISARFLDAVENSITLAEESASNASAAANANEVVKRTLQVATESEVERHVLSIAASAAQAVAAGPSGSATWGRNAYQYGLELAEVMPNARLKEQLDSDFQRLDQARREFSWTDDSPVANRLLGPLS